MAAVQGQISELVGGGINDKRRAQASNAVANVSVITNATNLRDLNQIETALLALAGPVYTQAVLNQMTINDKIYAYRRLVDGGSI